MRENEGTEVSAFHLIHTVLWLRFQRVMRRISAIYKNTCKSNSAAMMADHVSYNTDRKLSNRWLKVNVFVCIKALCGCNAWKLTLLLKKIVLLARGFCLTCITKADNFWLCATSRGPLCHTSIQKWSKLAFSGWWSGHLHTIILISRFLVGLK